MKINEFTQLDEFITKASRIKRGFNAYIKQNNLQSAKSGVQGGSPPAREEHVVECFALSIYFVFSIVFVFIP